MVVGHVGWLGPSSCCMSHRKKNVTKKYGGVKGRQLKHVLSLSCLSCLICLVLSCLVLSSSSTSTASSIFDLRASSNQCTWTGALKSLDSHCTVFDKFQDGKMAI